MSENNDFTNKATVKVVRQQLHEINELTLKYNHIGSEHVKLINNFADLKILNANLKKENVVLRALLQQWTDENNSLQASLDDAQREIDRLSEVLEKC